MQTTDTAMQTRLRPMRRDDLPAVLRIEAASFPLPWEEQDFRDYLCDGHCPGVVSEIGGAVVGYMVYELHRTRIHLANLAVHPDYRRKGVGAGMVASLRSMLRPWRRNRLTADVSEATLGAHLFLRACGLTAVGVERCAVESVYRFQLKA